MSNSSNFGWTSTLAASCALLLAVQVAAFGQDAAPEAAEPTQTAAATDAASDQPAPLTEDELEVLVARIALYPDELVAAISAASLFPLQIVEASRFLDDYAEDSSLEPKESWDGSVISLLNYPEIVKMMSDDLEWTQALGDAIAYQQQDVLVAIQQLRDEAVANGVIETDDKITVVQEGDNVVIQPTNTETVYVPQYPPEMLYTPGYAVAPVTYYPNPYPSYYYPTATFFAGFVTGVAWAAIVDWNDWGVWGGSWGGDVDIDINCRNCFNNRDFNGNIKWNDVDWKNVDRDKISIDRDQFAKIDRTNVTNNIRTDIKSNQNNSIRNKATNVRGERPSTLPARSGGARDVRASTLEGLKQGPAARPDRAKPAAKPQARPQAKAKPQARAQPKAGKKASTANRRSGKPKAAAKPDRRSKKPSALGSPKRGKKSKVHAKRGHKSKAHHVKHRGGGKRGGRGRRR